MKFVRMLSRLALLSLAAAAFVRLDGNLWRFSAVSFAKSAVAGLATASSVRTRSWSVPRTRW